MLDFITQILGYVEMLWSYFVNFLTTLLLFFDTVAGAMALPLGMIGYLPPMIGTAVTVVVSVSVVKLILGR